MVTITAPGVEINELDLSQYSFPAPQEETQNVFITGFASQGIINTPYEFTSKNEVSDLIATFGKPTNEAERYFINACAEAIAREKVVLFATRLPYDNEQLGRFNIAKYKVSVAEFNSALSVDSAISSIDTSIDNTNVGSIVAVETNTITQAQLDAYRSNQTACDDQEFIIVEKNQETYKKIPVDSDHTTDDDRYMLGVLPVVTTAANALYFQKLITNSTKLLNEFEPLTNIESNGKDLTDNLMVYPTNSSSLDDNDKNAMTISKYAAAFFPTINVTADGKLDRDRLKNIGVVVFKGIVDAENGNKIKYEPVEAFAGSLKSDDVDPVTGESRFIDDIINTNSKTIEFYSNCFNSKISKDSEPIYVKFANLPTTSKFKTYTDVDAAKKELKGKIKVGDLVKIKPNTENSITTEYLCTQITDKVGNNEDEIVLTLKSSITTISTKDDVTIAVGKKYKLTETIATSNKDKIEKGVYVKDKDDNVYVCSEYIKADNIISYDEISIFKTQTSASVIGFKELAESDKKISYTTIMQSLDKIFAKNKDINEKQIDLVVDAGVSNIAQFTQTVSELETYNPLERSIGTIWDICKDTDGIRIVDNTKTNTWALVLKKYDDFCKTRKDCMFLADGLRPLCLIGNMKRVNKRTYNKTIENTISPDMKFISGKIDTSYGAGNCDWYQIVDPTSGVNMWMPPSVKTMDAILDTTNAKFPWSVPAGVNNGKMNPENNPSSIIVKDIAFSPSTVQAGDIYTKSWNYATYYYDAGFCVEGQRTFQSRPTAFDRINVRRLFLYLERKVAMAAKYFIYEGNTAYTRQRLIDVITPYFEHAKINGGLYDYRLQCDDKNNTPDTIDRNELHVKVAIKPTKAIEFIECTFVALRTGASFTEAGMND